MFDGREKIAAGWHGKRPMKLARLAWCGASLAALVWSLMAFDGTPNWDGEEVLLYAMLALSFPVSVLGVAVISGAYAGIQLLAHVDIVASRLEMAAWWSVLCLLGYAQWFVFVPRVIGRFRGGRRAGTA